MKKYISIGLALTLVCALLAGCGNTTTSTNSSNTVNNDTEIVENTNTSTSEVAPPAEVFTLAGEVVELGDGSIVIKRLSTEEDSQNNVTIKYDYSDLTLAVGNIIKVAYTEESESNEITGIIEVTFVAEDLKTFENPDSEAETKVKEWGIEMTAENVTSSGLTLVCNQAGGENLAELNVSSFYNVQVLKDGNYIDAKYILDPSEVAWDSMAHIITLNGETKWDINWEHLYGKLPVGEYRISKEITNFKGPNESEKEYIFVNFEITE